MFEKNGIDALALPKGSIELGRSVKIIFDVFLEKLFRRTHRQYKFFSL